MHSIFDAEQQIINCISRKACVIQSEDFKWDIFQNLCTASIYPWMYGEKQWPWSNTRHNCGIIRLINVNHVAKVILNTKILISNILKKIYESFGFPAKSFTSFTDKPKTRMNRNTRSDKYSQWKSNRNWLPKLELFPTSFTSNHAV